jgi:hypothetical protein
MSVRADSKHKLYDSLFDGMHQYMYSAENLLRLENRNVSVKHIMKDVKTNHKEGVHNNRQSKPASASASKSITYEPRQHDTLFWCFFIAKHGFDEYELIKSTPFQTEKQFKISSVDLVREKADILKAHKLKVMEVENELVNESRITLIGLRALALVHGVSIFYVAGSTYCDFEHGEESDSQYGIIIRNKEKNKYSIRYKDESADEYMKKIRDTHFHISNPCKPINAISGYTLPQLHEICKKLSISILRSDGKKETKKCLYESIMNAL